MPATKKYVVTQPFTISYENGKQTIDVSEGDVILFDGFNFQVGDVTGMSAALKVVVRAGEWVVPDEEGMEPPELHSKPVVTLARSYNATGGVQVEMSDPASDMSIYQGRRTAQTAPGDELGEIVQQYERETEKAGTTMVSSDMSDIDQEVTRPTPKVEIQEVREVAQVSDSAKKAAQTSSGVVTLREPAAEQKRPVVQGQRMAKQTAPSQPAEGYRHIKVDSQSSGVEVMKVTDRSDSAMMKRTAATEKRQVVQHQTVAKATSRPASQRTDVGSSTQATVEKMKVEPVAEVTVVSKVRDEHVNEVRDGIKSTMTVRASDEFGDGQVTSTSADGISLSGGDDLDVSDILQDA
jgi:hypothetical protein